MGAHDGDAEYERLKGKLENGEELNDEDMLKLIFLVTMKSEKPKAEVAATAIELTKSIGVERKRLACQGAIIGFASRILEEDGMKQLTEVLKSMDNFAVLAQVANDYFAQKKIDEVQRETAKKQLKLGIKASDIQSTFGFDDATMKKLQSEIA
jgi:hypothetical protein